MAQGLVFAKRSQQVATKTKTANILSGHALEILGFTAKVTAGFLADLTDTFLVNMSIGGDIYLDDVAIADAADGTLPRNPDDMLFTTGARKNDRMEVTLFNDGAAQGGWNAFIVAQPIRRRRR